MENNQFGDLLCKLREDKNLTYSQVADEINNKLVDEKIIKKWEKGLEYPKIEHLYKLAEIYDIEPEKLLEEKQKTIQINVDTIHYRFIDWLSKTLNISTNVLIWGVRAILAIALILVFLWFYGITVMVVGK